MPQWPGGVTRARRPPGQPARTMASFSMKVCVFLAQLLAKHLFQAVRFPRVRGLGPPGDDYLGEVISPESPYTMPHSRLRWGPPDPCGPFIRDSAVARGSGRALVPWLRVRAGARMLVRELLQL